MNAINWYFDVITAANTAKDGTGTVNFIYGPTLSDAYIDRVVFRAAGTNVASCARLFVNNGESNATANNNVLFAEKTLAATTLDEAAAFADNVINTDLWLPAGCRLFVVLGTAVAAGYYVTAVAGKYHYSLEDIVDV